jgi:hypothetical protein
MPDKLELINRVTLLEQEVKELKKAVARIQGATLKGPQTAHQSESAAGDNTSEEILSWVNTSAFLPRLSTICFLLVVALILRTVTDNNIIDQQFGSLLGMTYAGILMFTGWYKYNRPSPLAPVFAVCGAVLMFIIVVETNARFESIPSIPAYLILMFTGAGMASISYQHKVALPVLVGTLGMCFAAFIIDYPNPIFPYLIMLLLFANILGCFAVRLQKCSWLRWILLGLTLLAMQVWGFKLGFFLGRDAQPPAGQAPFLFLPAVALLFATYLGISLLAILRQSSQKISRFDFSLPTINVIWAFVAAQHIVTAWSGNLVLLGAVGGVIGSAHLGLALRLGHRQLTGAPGTNSFALAGSILLALSLPLLSAGTLIYLAVLSALAALMTHLSIKWRSGGVRATSYLLQIYVGAALAFFLFRDAPGAMSIINAAAAGLAALLALNQFRWCRQQAPPEESLVFSRFDREDRTAIFLLLFALTNGFFMLRVLLYKGLAVYPGDFANAFACSQSIIINSAAAGLMLFAFIRRNKEVRNIAILVTIIGGGRVFLFDLFSTQGFPLVISVFTFGVVVAVQSVILSKWQRLPGEKPKEVATYSISQP